MRINMWAFPSMVRTLFGEVGFPYKVSTAKYGFCEHQSNKNERSQSCGKMPEVWCSRLIFREDIRESADISEKQWTVQSLSQCKKETWQNLVTGPRWWVGGTDSAARRGKPIKKKNNWPWIISHETACFRRRVVQFLRGPLIKRLASQSTLWSVMSRSRGLKLTQIKMFAAVSPYVVLNCLSSCKRSGSCTVGPGLIIITELNSQCRSDWQQTFSAILL